MAEFVKKPIRDYQQNNASRRSLKADLEALAIAGTTHNLMSEVGGRNGNQQVFEGNTYRFVREGDNLSITAKDGRGEIFSSKNGVMNNRMNSTDVNNIRQLDERISQMREENYSQQENRQNQLEGDDRRRVKGRGIGR